jgi:hypothetical protein
MPLPVIMVPKTVKPSGDGLTVYYAKVHFKFISSDPQISGQAICAISQNIQQVPGSQYPVWIRYADIQA